MPFEHTRQIPAGLAERHAPVIAGRMTATVDVRHPDQQGTRDPVSGRTAFAKQAPFYDGCARVQAQGTGPAGEGGSGQYRATGGYLVAVPHHVTEARIGDVVRVRDGGDDPALAGLVLVVVEVPAATVILQRDLRCELYEKAQKGST